MKHLYLLRHGKSDWSADYDGDHERPLAPRGRDAAERMGRLLQALRQRPDRVVSSGAVRARETTRLAAAAGGWRCPVQLDATLYESTPETVLERVQGTEDRVERLLLVGHEPCWSLCLTGMIGGGEARMPTAALARIDLDVTSWLDCDFGRGRLAWLLTPKLLKKIGWP